MVRPLSLATLLVVLWLLMSGIFSPLYLILGAVSVVLVMWFANRMHVADDEGVPSTLGRRTFVYWPWLVKEIALSNWDVAKRILSPKLDISPVTFRVKASQKTPLGRTIYANSITLTPGTVSMRIDGDEILVHALTEDGRDSLLEGSMDRKAAWFEGGSE